MDNIFKGIKSGDTEAAEETIINSSAFINATPGRFRHNTAKRAAGRPQEPASFDNRVEKRNKHVF